MKKDIKSKSHKLSGTSYAPFFVLATTLHAFPMGWVLWERGASIPAPIPPLSFQVMISEIDPALYDVHSTSLLPESPELPKPTALMKPTGDIHPKPSSPSVLKKEKSIPREGISSAIKKKPSLRKNDHLFEAQPGEGGSLTSPPPPSSHIPQITPHSQNRPPVYPLEARQQEIEGTVWLHLTITSSGIVKQVKAIAPYANPHLEKAALQAVQQWLFVIESAEINETKELIRQIPIHFQLRKNKN